MNIITGEKIQKKCDYYIGSINDFNFNPAIKYEVNKFINIENYDLDKIHSLLINNIFCYTHIIDSSRTNYTLTKSEQNYKNLKIILNNIRTKFNIFFHNSDCSFLVQHIELLNIPNLKNIYTQNIDICPQERIIPLPIGIANSQWKHGNLDIWKNILENTDLNNKHNNIYFNFKIETNKNKRKSCYNIIKSKKIPNLKNTDYLNYLKTLSTYKYAICPEGNGIDTHRLWECLYLKVIPICLHNHVTEYYSNIFPIVLLDDWNNIDDNMLQLFYTNSNWDNYKNLSFDNLSPFQQ